jgi:UDPglucose 6-dehydrogenase/UDP-N-acetyl-D-galactosamine dehydrogenase
MQVRPEKTIICIVGLGYVGLPLASAFSRVFKVIGFDINTKRVEKLKLNNDNQNLIITDDPRVMKQADFIIIAVPTPVTPSKEPDLSYVTGAARIVSQNMKVGSIVALESTVYPGVTEELVKPILEEGGLQCGKDFKIAYSPERINPGDNEHSIEKVVKVVSGMDKETTKLVAQLYLTICPQVFETKDIKTAEAAKVIENVQRDLNIALVNELSLIFERMHLSTKDVLDAAATKWNFHRYSPGLVGGHCIPVAPYYLVYKARELGFNPQVILAGRSTNDNMAGHVAQMSIKGLNDVGKVIKGSRVLIMGLTYKENVPDTSETPVKEVIKELEEYGVEVLGYDPLLDDIENEFGIKGVPNLNEPLRVDCIIMAVAHSAFRGITLKQLRNIMCANPVLVDVRGVWDRNKAEREGFYYRAL